MNIGVIQTWQSSSKATQDIISVLQIEWSYTLK